MAASKKNELPAKIFTIGFMKKGAENFFYLLELHLITHIIDVRLHHNNSRVGFTKSSDLKFFLRRICGIEYRHDSKFVPDGETLKLYKNQLISWDDYVEAFARQMKARHIESHILRNYSNSPEVRYCLLCAEVSAEKCHRRLVAEKFAEVFEGMEIVHL